MCHKTHKSHFGILRVSYRSKNDESNTKVIKIYAWNVGDCKVYILKKIRIQIPGVTTSNSH